VMKRGGNESGSCVTADFGKRIFEIPGPESREIVDYLLWRMK
jgi:hypothetical protein